MKSALALAAGCQAAYLSRVLADRAELSLEQADAISAFLGHSDPENHYFLLCVQLARAGTPRLRGKFEAQLEEIRRKREDLKERFRIQEALSPSDQATYYSSWLYAAAHLCASVPRLASRDAIASHLGITPAHAARILEFLVGCGMVRHDGGRFHLGNARVHLGADSPLISKHHANWRLQAMRALDRDPEADELHYTSVVSLSRADRHQLKERLLRVIDEFNATVAPSPEEEVCCLALDFFGV